MTNINRQWVLAKRPRGMVGKGNFEYHEGRMPKPGAGKVLVKNLYLSFEPAQRGWLDDRPSYLPPVKIGEVMRAITVSEIVASKHPEFAVGDTVMTGGGWQDYCVVTPGAGPFGLTKLPRDVPPTMCLSVLGVTGLTAYWGMLDIGKPVAGETVLVSGAAGATGSIAGQIARIKGCRVIGIAGGRDKCAWLKKHARFAAVIDYKSEDVDARIGKLCPKGVDIFFDNVAGDILEAALNHLAQHARIVACGGISGYNASKPTAGPSNLLNLIIMRARMEGFILLDYLDRSHIAVPALSAWVAAGELVFQEDIQHGFKNIPSTLTRLFTGKNVGKQLLKID